MNLPWEQAEMRELKVMTLGRQLSLVHSSKNSSASFQSPAFSQALIRLLYVITLRSHPCSRQPCITPTASYNLICPGTSLPEAASQPCSCAAAFCAQTT